MPAVSISHPTRYRHREPVSLGEHRILVRRRESHDQRHAGFSYQRREEKGIRTPLETVAPGTGSCRDFAAPMLEAVRALGLAARSDVPGSAQGAAQC